MRPSFLATALLAATLLVSAPAHAYYENTYFPLAVGNGWTYVEWNNARSTVTVDDMRASSVSGQLYFRLKGYNGSAHWVRQTSTQRVYEQTSRPWYRLGAAVGASWGFSINASTGGAIPCSQGSQVEMVSRDERVTVPAGTFSTIHVRFRSACADAGITDEWFARGVGLVKRTQQSIAGPRQQVLESAVISGQVIGTGSVSTPAPTGGAFGIAGSVPASRVRLRTLLASGLNRPTAMAFSRDGSLWIVNRGDDSTVIVTALGSASQAASKFRDDSSHFMNNPMAIAFSRTRNEFATVQENANDYNGHAHPNNFTGPTLWTADRSLFEGGTNSHLDMLHHSPLALGIAAGADSVRREYWVFNGQSGSIDRYLFGQPHALGADDHADGVTVRYAAGQLRRAAGIPGHMALDVASGRLYVADTGNGRVVRLNTLASVAPVQIPAHHNETPLYEARGTTVDRVTPLGALAKPAGLLLVSGRLVVSDYANGHVKVFSENGTLEGDADTGLGANAVMGLCAGSGGRLLLLDARNSQLIELEVRP